MNIYYICDFKKNIELYANIHNNNTNIYCRDKIQNSVYLVIKTKLKGNLYNSNN